MGDIFVLGFFDFDKGKKFYNLMIKVIDCGNLFQEVEEKVFVYINVFDVNDNLLVFVFVVYNKDVLESVDLGVFVVQVIVIDKDMGINVKFIFLIIDGDDVDMFVIMFDFNNGSIGIIFIFLKID